MFNRMSVAAKACATLCVVCLAAAVVLVVKSFEQDHPAPGRKATAMPGKGSESTTAVPGAGTFGDETINTLIEEDRLAPLARAGDESAKLRLAKATAELAQLRKRAESGDVGAALMLDGKLSLAGRPDEALEVLRMPSVRDSLRVQRILMTILPNMILENIRRCEPVEAALLSEYIGVLGALSSKGDELATAYLIQMSSVVDQYSAREVMEAIYPSSTLPVCQGN